MRLDPHGIAVAIDEQVAVEGDVSLALEQRLAAVLVEEVAVDRVTVVGAARLRAGSVPPARWDAPTRPNPHSGLAKTLWRMIGDVRPDRQAGNIGPGKLVLDLKVVSDRVDDEAALDQPGNEGGAAVRIAQVDPRARPDDRHLADHPVPGRALGRDADGLLVVAVTTDDEIFQRDVVRRAGLPLGLHGIHRDVVAFQHQIADDQMVRVDDADRVVSGPRDEGGGRAALGSRDGDRSTRFARKPVRRQAVPVRAGGEDSVSPARRRLSFGR